MFPLTGLPTASRDNYSLHATGPAVCCRKGLPNTINAAKSTSRWLGEVFRMSGANRGQDCILTTITPRDSQHPFGGQATGHFWPALGFAPQPYDWFAFSRMMTLQALITRRSKSPCVGQASSLTEGKSSPGQKPDLLPGEEEVRVVIALAGLHQGADVHHVMPPPQTYVSSFRSQTPYLRQSKNIPRIPGGATRIRHNRRKR